MNSAINAVRHPSLFFSSRLVSGPFQCLIFAASTLVQIALIWE
jgi:hypothetical protein